jgi:multiple sugar transport system permease protein
VITRRIARALPLTPALVLILLFLGGPIVYCAWIAFTDLQLTGQAHSSFVGFANFRRASRDDAFLNAVWLTLVLPCCPRSSGRTHWASRSPR